jgi:hypothetical protein
MRLETSELILQDHIEEVGMPQQTIENASIIYNLSIQRSHLPGAVGSPGKFRSQRQCR